MATNLTGLPLTTGVTGILPTANGGTGIAFFTAAGPTVARVYTFPDAAATVLTTNAAVTVAQGGTGAATFTANGVLYGNTTSAIQVTAQGGTNTILTASAGAPSFSATPIINTSVQLGVVSSTTGSLKLANASSALLTTIQAGNATAAVTYIWPTADGSSGQQLTTNGSGTLSWAAAGGSASALSAITAATATNTIDNANFAQEWDWSTLSTQTGMLFTANAVSTGTALKVTSTSTAGGASGSSFLLDLARSGANTNSSHTAYGIRSQVTDTGTSSTNIGGYFSASGASSNYGLIVNAGSVGIGTTTPNSTLDVQGSMSNAAATKTASYTLTASDHTIFANLSGNITITLPAAGSGTIGREYRVIRVDSTVNTLTIAVTGSDTLKQNNCNGSGQYAIMTIVGDTATSWVCSIAGA
ncbi:hypothetical protein HYZ64_03715 [Candidatus Berkelbacteria bacterium]|nr:hypothetical protein [Candidatus Berkelbacteria bacterium]